MPFVVRDKNTNLFAKVKKRGWPRSIEWVEDINHATSYRNQGAALISCGHHTKSPKRGQLKAEIDAHRATMNEVYGPFNGISRISRASGEETPIRNGWPQEEKEKHYRMCNRYDRTPFGHMVLAENLEILPIGVSLK